jgi:acetolactate synthase-1/2/3 large subunit
MTGAEAVVRSLELLGVTDVFGLPGGAILPVYDPLMDSKKLRHILVRHEQGAGHAAQGYASATGKTGVCIATSGPGATNLVTAIADAYMDSVPLLAITGQVFSHLMGTGSGHRGNHNAHYQALILGYKGRRHPCNNRCGLSHCINRSPRSRIG